MKRERETKRLTGELLQKYHIMTDAPRQYLKIEIRSLDKKVLSAKEVVRQLAVIETIMKE